MTAAEFRRIALSLPQVREALITAWRNRVPKRLAEQVDGA